MLNTRKLAPGRKGTKRLHEQFGDCLLCVRYHYDDQLRKRFKTVELIVEEAPSTPPTKPLATNAFVGVHIEMAEVELQRKIKQALRKMEPGAQIMENSLRPGDQARAERQN